MILVHRISLLVTCLTIPQIFNREMSAEDLRASGILRSVER